MKSILLSVALVATLSGPAYAQSAAAPAATAAAKTAPPQSATVSAVCKDGTSFSGSTLKGACRGHGGVDKKSAATAATVAPVPAAQTAKSTPPAQVAAGGGAGKVWVNTATKIYHCQGDRY